MGGVSGGSFVLSWRGAVIRSDCVSFYHGLTIDDGLMIGS